MTTKTPKKRSAGRPLVLPTRGRKHSLYATDDDWERLKRLGGGRAAAGLRRLLDLVDRQA